MVITFVTLAGYNFFLDSASYKTVPVSASIKMAPFASKFNSPEAATLPPTALDPTPDAREINEKDANITPTISSDRIRFISTFLSKKICPHSMI
jgi:hypothetical protein